MKTKNALRRTLLLSVLATLLCLAMLAGTTFAWFTDTASTGVNQILAGNLDVKLMYSTDMTTWKEATTDTQMFDNNALWEPGRTEVIYLKIVNNGNLDLKFQTNFARGYRVTRGKSVLGNYYYIGDYLKIGTAETDTAFATREDAQAAIAATEKPLTKGVQLTDGWITLEAGQSTNPLAVVLYMPADVGNEANAKSKTWTSKIFQIGLEVIATQVAAADRNLVFERVEFTGNGPYTVEGNYQADGGYGVIHATKNSHVTINAGNVFAVESDARYAMAVYASDNATVIINSGDFTQQITGDSNQYDLIYADTNATIEIYGGTFKSATPKWTLNCADGSGAKIILKGGTFYQYNPLTDVNGNDNITVADGYKVVQDGDWFTVVAE